MPRGVFVGRREDVSDETRRARIDVSVRPHEAFRDGPDARNDSLDPIWAKDQPRLLPLD